MGHDQVAGPRDRPAVAVVGAVAGNVDDLPRAVDVVFPDERPPAQQRRVDGVAAARATALFGQDSGSEPVGVLLGFDDGPGGDHLL